MKLYYSPGACSLASHIALVEGGADFEAVKVDLETHETEDGKDFYQISPRGYVPLIDTGEYGLITENPAVLMYLADKTQGPPKGHAFYDMLEWIGFVGTEIHGSYHPLFSDADDAEKAEAKKTLAKKYELAEKLMDGSEWLVGEAPSVADNYLFVTLLWADKMGVEVPQSLKDFRARNMERAAVKTAMQAEGLG